MANSVDYNCRVEILQENHQYFNGEFLHQTVSMFPIHCFDHIPDFKEILTVMGIPEENQSVMLQKIELVALKMDSYDGNYMEVKIIEVNYRETRPRVEEDDIARAERESMEVEARPFPATKSSIDALERVVFDVSAPASDCAVCLEEISAGKEVILMPCSHVYHSDCIVQWLQTSHFCPLCRYHMPCEL
ncbi:E3 UBIQUITIN-PROTEIN LIGASE PRAJA [Salix purpurea]|uniref:RING-type E3 ubiquitin transferase n=1 Tax=Salix purpurea TaxID=77065 RepID=A0A9Q0V4L9_SALPP|nr:E3 UBIQUITIN-PROTEIN LIGASE PRAJA [Salix purpurea]